MAYAVTRAGPSGEETVIYGPGDELAGAFHHATPLDASPESVAEAAEDDAVLRDGWVRTLAQHEAEIAAARDAGDRERAERLRAAVERSAYAQIQLATLDGLTDQILTAAGVAPTERARAVLRGLLSGGRDERTWRRWRSGAQLVPEGAADFLGRIRRCEIVASEEPEGSARRLVLELVLDD